MEVCSCFRTERQRQSKSTVFLKFVRILKFVKIREFQEFLKFIKFEFAIYAIYGLVEGLRLRVYGVSVGIHAAFSMGMG